MISFTDVTFGYDDRNPVLNRLSFHIGRGEFAALIGQNGAGKTTILKHMNGLLKPVQGRVLVGGMDTRQASVSQMARKIGFLFQNPDHQIFLPTVAREIAYGPVNLGLKGDRLHALVREAARDAGIEALLDRMPQSLGRGLRQRVALASVLAMQPAVLVLDEPTTGQDEAEAAGIMAVVRAAHRRGTTIVLVTHDMELAAEYAERILVLMGGRLVLDGPPDEVFDQTAPLLQAGIRPPVSHLLRRLGLFGIPGDVDTGEAV